MNTLKTLVLVGLCLTLATSAVAERTITATRIDDSEFQSAGVARSKAACQYGNLNNPTSILSGWFTGAEGYKYLFNPFEQECSCPDGFQLTSVSMFLNFPDTETYPVEFNAWVDLEEAELSAPGCWVPGPELCVGSTFTVTIQTAGNYHIALPITCECAFMDYYYFLSFHFDDMFVANIIVDDVPLACTSYNDWGSGWVDLSTQGFDVYGMPIIYGDAECCASPVPNETTSWSKVKKLFR